MTIASRPRSDTFLTVHNPTFHYIFQEMFFTTCKIALLANFVLAHTTGTPPPQGQTHSTRSKSHVLPQTPTFSEDELALYQRRFDEGFDLDIDEKYNA